MSVEIVSRSDRRQQIVEKGAILLPRPSGVNVVSGTNILSSAFLLNPYTLGTVGLGAAIGYSQMKKNRLAGAAIGALLGYVLLKFAFRGEHCNL